MVGSKLIVFATTLSIGVASAMQCPGSIASVHHAKAQVTVSAQTTCKNAMAEMTDRVMENVIHKWDDPHNKGKYRVQWVKENQIAFLRRAAVKQAYEDDLLFTFTDTPEGGCKLEGCSESQVTSVADFSTNYCNLRNLYCGSDDGCKPVHFDFKSTEDDVTTSFGAGKDPKKCNTISASDEPALLQAPRAMQCPGSIASVHHAKAQVTVSAQTTCKNAMAEMTDRVMENVVHKWDDPHNKGKYRVQWVKQNQISLTRTAAVKQAYEDDLLFTFTDTPEGGCKLEGCSESQVTSFLDFSTNYCNLRNLYCGKADNCKPVKYDFKSTEDDVTTSTGAGKDPTKCNTISAENDITV